MNAARPDVIVVGGGVLGCAIALRLADDKISTIVLERAVPGAEASSAAAGILGPALEAGASRSALAFGIRSRHLHATLADRFRAEHGMDVGFRPSGALVVALNEEENRELEVQADSLRAHDVRCSLLDAAAARALEPQLSNRVLRALELPDEAQVDPPLLLKALAMTAERAGAQFRAGTTVRRIVVGDHRVQGVELDDGLLEAGIVIVAAGSWTSLVPGLPLPPKTIFPIRGQLLMCDTRPPVFSRIVFGAGGYVVTRPDGRALCGSTMEDVGFDRAVTMGGLESILRTAIALAPSLRQAPVMSHWSSFRPATADGEPLIGRLPPEGLFVASGHFRNGILLAPATADLIAQAIAGKVGSELTAYDPQRFLPATRPR